MTRFLALFITIISTLVFSLHADERIGGTLENVDLLIEDIYSDEGHNFGEKYSVINRDKASMRVTIRLTESENIEDHLIDHAIIVDPHRRVDLGYIQQKDVAKGACWKYEWKAQRDK